jgi:hypothetical protein
MTLRQAIEEQLRHKLPKGESKTISFFFCDVATTMFYSRLDCGAVQGTELIYDSSPY